MKILYFTLISVVLGAELIAQGNFCNVNGNLMVFTNYDGGALNIDIDQDIPNLKIGVVSYEATTINLSGTFVGNVTGVVYAGYSGTNNHCATGTVTSINGAPVGATKNILFAPPVTQSNPNGYNSIICGSTCSITTSQGGCNTIDQIESYMLNYFPGSVLFAHKVQYGCWSGSQALSAGGTCCASITSLTLTTRVIDESCASNCDGQIIAGAAGGQSPYTITVNGTSNFNNLCAGKYGVKVVDGLSNTLIDSVDILAGGTLPPVGSNHQTFCSSATVADLIATGTTVQWYSGASGGTPLLLSTPLVNNSQYFASQTVAGCESGSRLDVLITIEVNDVSVTVIEPEITANAIGVTYQWLDCENAFQPIAGATGRTFKPSSNGIYAVLLTENSCSDTSACVQITTIGIDEKDMQKGAVIYPNPVTSEIYLKSEIALKNAVFTILDSQGRMVDRKNGMSGTSFQYDVSELPNGIYVLDYRDQHSFGQIKFQKH